MRILGIICFAIAEFAFVVGCCLAFHRRGYSRGYDDGRIAGEQWMWEAEISVQKEREAIWKAEP